MGLVQWVINVPILVLYQHHNHLPNRIYLFSVLENNASPYNAHHLVKSQAVGNLDVAEHKLRELRIKGKINKTTTQIIRTSKRKLSWDISLIFISPSRWYFIIWKLLACDVPQILKEVFLYFLKWEPNQKWWFFESWGRKQATLQQSERSEERQDKQLGAGAGNLWYASYEVREEGSCFMEDKHESPGQRRVSRA